MNSSFKSIAAFNTQGPENQSIYLSGQKILPTISVMKTVRERDSKILTRFKRQTDHGQTELARKICQYRRVY